MIIETLPVGKLETNCYLAGDPETLLVIDPGAEAENIIKHITDKGYHVAYVVLTHCHYDHVNASAELIEKTGAKLLIGAKEAENYQDRHVTLCGYFEPKTTLLPPDGLLADGDEISAGNCTFRVIETPGHTSGGISLLCEDNLFSGDTLFYESVGRSDLPTGDMKVLTLSIKDKIFTLDEHIAVYPGHGPKTTVGHEQKYNSVYAWQLEQLLYHE